MDVIQKTNYGSNSDKSKESKLPQQKTQEKRIEQVVDGNVKVKKKGFFGRVKDALVSDDSVSVKSYILNDVVIPSAKKLISEIVTNGIDIMLYGESRHSNKSNSSRVSYTKYYDSRYETRVAPPRMQQRYNEYVVPTKADAERILDVLEEAISTYGFVTVADFYDAIGVSSDYTDNNYGWKNLSSARTIPTRDGWLIELPRALPID